VLKQKIRLSLEASGRSVSTDFRVLTGSAIHGHPLGRLDKSFALGYAIPQLWQCKFEMSHSGTHVNSSDEVAVSWNILYN